MTMESSRYEDLLGKADQCYPAYLGLLKTTISGSEGVKLGTIELGYSSCRFKPKAPPYKC